MKLEFADGTQIEVISIHGGQQHIRGAQRDVLTIDVDPEEHTINELIVLFRDAEKTASLKTISDDAERNEIGAEYTIYLSATNEMREIPPEPGVLEPTEYVSVNVVKIAQLTYAEKYTGDKAGLISALQNELTSTKAALNTLRSEVNQQMTNELNAQTGVKG